MTGIGAQGARPSRPPLAPRPAAPGGGGETPPQRRARRPRPSRSREQRGIRAGVVRVTPHRSRAAGSKFAGDPEANADPAALLGRRVLAQPPPRSLAEPALRSAKRDVRARDDSSGASRLKLTPLRRQPGVHEGDSNNCEPCSGGRICRRCAATRVRLRRRSHRPDRAVVQSGVVILRTRSSRRISKCDIADSKSRAF